MSSFPSHVENIEALKELGVDVSNYLDVNGNVSVDSWSCDEFVDLLGDAIDRMIVMHNSLYHLRESEQQPTISDYLEDNKEMIGKTKAKMVSISSLEKFMRGES
jgi:hypothetical protein